MTLISPSPTAPEIKREWQEVNGTLRTCISHRVEVAFNAYSSRGLAEDLKKCRRKFGSTHSECYRENEKGCDKIQENE